MARPSTPEEDPSPPLETLRVAAAERVRETSLRYVAREIGVTPTSLKQFITTDKTPYGRTLARLRAWYRRDLLELGEELSAEGAGTALELLLRQVPMPLRHRAIRALVTRIASLHREAGAEVPSWVPTVRKAYAAGNVRPPPQGGGKAGRRADGL